MQLAGTRIVVTGGAQGIGAGAGSAVHRTCDVSDRRAVDEAFTDAIGHLGGLDVLFNAAGVLRAVPTAELGDDLLDLVLDVNARGTMLTNQRAFTAMRDGGGRIINVGSAAGLIGMSEVASYTASKGAVMAWTRSVAHEWDRNGVTVNGGADGVR